MTPLVEIKSTGTNFWSRAGAFPLRRYQPEGDGAESSGPSGQAAPNKPRSSQDSPSRSRLQSSEPWANSRTMSSAIARGRIRGWSSMLQRTGAFEIVVVRRRHRRIGKPPDGSDDVYLQDAGEALKVAVEDGNSRFGRASGNGFGMGQIFRALANHDGELRFRSARPRACGSRA